MFFKKPLRKIMRAVLFVTKPFIIALMLNAFVFQVTAVTGESMLQTLHDKDVYVISKIGSVFQSYPNYGEIVVIDSRVWEKRTILTAVADLYNFNAVIMLITKNQEDIYWVKRVIGLPGDRLYLADGIVYRNGEALDEPYINPAEEPFYKNNEYIVPEGYIFVLGDNRNHSADSRNIGAIPVENIIGTVGFKLMSGDNLPPQQFTKGEQNGY